eukprot:403363567
MQNQEQIERDQLKFEEDMWERIKATKLLKNQQNIINNDQYHIQSVDQQVEEEKSSQVQQNLEPQNHERLFYQHMNDVITDNQLFGIEAKSEEQKSSFMNFCQHLMSLEDNIHFQYKMMPHALDVLKDLKQKGIKIVACSNSSIPQKRKKVLERFGFVIDEIFDDFVVSGDVSFRKPDPEILKIIFRKYPDVKPFESVVIGDSIGKDIVCGHLAGTRSIQIVYSQSNKAKNYKKIEEGHVPDFTILDLRQISYILDVMNEDANFLNQQNQDYQDTYRQHLKVLPSQNRIKVGLLQDGDGINRIDQFWNIGILQEDMNMGFLPLNLEDPFHLYGKIDVLMQKGQDIIADYHTEQGQAKAKLLQEYIDKHNIVVLDPLENAMILQSRVKFLEFMDQAIRDIQLKHNDNPIVSKLKSIKYVTVQNQENKGEVIAEYHMQAKSIDLQYPIVVKILQASRNPNSHNFYVVNTEEGLLEALNYKGFKNELLIFQQLINHQEQLYKLYVIGDKYDIAIKKSIPQDLVTTGPCYFFQTKMKFEDSSFTRFNKQNRLDSTIMKILANQLVETYGIELIGCDILIEEGTENLYIIDVNYFSSYENLPNINVQQAFKELIIRKYNERKHE